MFYKLNEDKTFSPCSVLEWCVQRDQMKKTNSFHVAQDNINNHKISTVWLGIDHSHGIGPPLLFETMIFNNDDYSGIYCERHTTWQEAENGHKLAIEWLKNKSK